MSKLFELINLSRDLNLLVKNVNKSISEKCKNVTRSSYNSPTSCVTNQIKYLQIKHENRYIRKVYNNCDQQ